MARDLVTVHEGTLDTTKSVLEKNITKTAITVGNGATLVGVTGCKDNSVTLIVEPSASGAITLKAGDYQNAVQGDLTIPLTASTPVAIQIERTTRFQKADGNIDVDFTAGTAGYLYLVGKHAGLEPVV